MQRYLQPILAAALSQNGQMQAPAVDILAFTIKQGLAHPLQVRILLSQSRRRAHFFSSASP